MPSTAYVAKFEGENAQPVKASFYTDILNTEFNINIKPHCRIAIRYVTGNWHNGRGKLKQSILYVVIDMHCVVYVHSFLWYVL